jgi:hypothetical protein
MHSLTNLFVRVRLHVAGTRNLLTFDLHLGLYAQTLEISRYRDYPQSIPARIVSKSIGLRLSRKA